MTRRDYGWLGLGALLATSLSGGLTLRPDGIRFPDGSVLQSADPRRAFYLTSHFVAPTDVLSACDAASGFEAASLWQVLDPSNLRYAYDHPEAWTWADSGSGPPSGVSGWIRTGNVAVISGGRGFANCAAWTDDTADGPGEGGTGAGLSPAWDFEPFPWDFEVWPCSSQRPVWCVQP